jgi:hypothetical protein
MDEAGNGQFVERDLAGREGAKKASAAFLLVVRRRSADVSLARNDSGRIETRTAVADRP